MMNLNKRRFFWQSFLNNFCESGKFQVFQSFKKKKEGFSDGSPKAVLNCSIHGFPGNEK